MRLIGTASDRPSVDLTGVDRRYLRMPVATPGLAIGLFGGSFNPPHEGHALVAETALRRLKLDRLWWMVTPGNPLKSRNELAPLAERIVQSEEIAPDLGIYGRDVLEANFQTEAHAANRRGGSVAEHGELRCRRGPRPRGAAGGTLTPIQIPDGEAGCSALTAKHLHKRRRPGEASPHT